jgi:cytochrome d ubiquinol oxidase subunit II
MDLNLIWFILLSVLLAGYAILDGFDLGVGIIQPVLKGEQERNVAIKAIGPLWDGNEVWLVTFGGALFAAFPEAYASILSAMYIPVMLLLYFLILRAISIDFRNKVESKFWKLLWDCGFVFSSLGATLVFGVAAGNLIAGLPIDERGDYTGTLVDLFGLYPLATGVLAVATFAMHGAMFLFLKSTGDVRRRLSGWLWHSWGFFLVAYILVSMMTLIENPHVVANIKLNKYGQAFASSCVNIGCLVALFGVSIFPELVHSTSEHTSITIYNGASSQGTLWLMCIIAMIGVPLITAYTVIVYWTFRHPIEME